jgi:hypothetical protein
MARRRLLRCPHCSAGTFETTAALEAHVAITHQNIATWGKTPKGGCVRVKNNYKIALS